MSKSRPSLPAATRRLCRALGVALLLATSAAGAIDITVNVLGDPPPNGCTPGDCSLREAVSLANSLAGPDRILLPSTPGLPLQLSIPGSGDNVNATGDLDVLDDLEIVGTGAATTTVAQTAADRVLHTIMDDDQRLVLRGLTLQGGRAPEGGGLYSTSLVTIEDAAFIGNDATFEGGAINFFGPGAPSITEFRLVMRRVRFESNTAMQLDGARGGALDALSFFGGRPFVLIEDCEFIDNEAKDGGGAIHVTGFPNNFGGEVVIRRSRFTGNRSGGEGGGAILATASSFRVQIEDSDFDTNDATGNNTDAAGAVNLDDIGSADVLRSTFSSNTGVRGGGLRSTAVTRIVDSLWTDNVASFGGGAVWGVRGMQVERSTFESNRVTSTDAADPGGGAIGFQNSQGAFLSVQRSTFSGNDAFRGGAISLVSGALQLYGSTIVASQFGTVGQSATALRILDETSGNPLAIANTLMRGSCSFLSAGRQLAVAYNNIESTGATCRLTTAIINAQNQVNASTAQIALGPLANNGGPTPTRLPGALSIAINAGRESFCTATDQRHFARADASCDIGAVEVGATPSTGAVFANGFE
jgi:predicted outer membrane repeat protein